MAAITSAALCSASAGVALPRGSSVQSLGSQNAIANVPLLPALRSNVSRRRAATIKAVKNDSGKDGTSRQRAGLAGLLLPSVAAMLIGGTPFAPDARAEMTSADYYKSLMESMKRNQTEASAPAIAPVLTQAPPVAAATVTTATPVATATAADEEISFSSLFSSALTETPKKAEAPKEAQPEQPKAPTAAELRAKRVEEVAKREREEAERRAAEQKAQAEARAKEAAAKAEKEAEQKTKEASEKAKRAAQDTAAKGAAEAAKSKKTHGYLPLFLAQFLMLALYAGAITVAFFLPKSASKQIEAKINELSERVGPLVEKVKPFADRAVTTGSKLTKQAQPLVGKAAQQVAPLVRKAVDASKPLVSQAQAKAGEALEKVKANQES